MHLSNDEISEKKRQNQQESFDDFRVALRDLIKTCSYCSDIRVNNALCDQIIEGLLDDDTVEKLLRQKILTFERTVQICRAHEAAKQQRQEIKGGHQTIAATSSYKSKKQQDHQSDYGQVKVPPTGKCSHCGELQHK